MQIFVKTIKGNTITMVDVSETVDSLKMQIAEIEGIQVEQQRLIYGAKEIESGHMLSEYNIQEQSTIHLMLGLEGGGDCFESQSPKSAKNMRIFVEGIRGDTITVENVSGTVDNLKEKIRAIEGIAVDQQWLRYRGKVLESGRRLSYYDVKDESTMEMYMFGKDGNKSPANLLAHMHNLNKMICRKCYCQLPPRATRCRHAKCGRTTDIRPKGARCCQKKYWPSNIWNWYKPSFES